MEAIRNKPLAVIGGGDSAAEEATCQFVHLFNVVLISSKLLRCRSHEIWLARLRSRKERRAPRFQDHGKAFAEQPQSCQ